MAIRPEGEFELVLGNRQLFSVLGIVVILMGIFFAMGFFAGKSVGQASAGATTARRAGSRTRLSEILRRLTLRPARRRQFPPWTRRQRPRRIRPQRRRRNRRLRNRSLRRLGKEPAPAKPATSKSIDQVVKPANGSYLQVASTRLSEAQSLAALLRKHQFHVVLAESSKPELVRVLVGPFSSSEAAAEARARLKNLDIPNVIPRKIPSKD